LLASFIDDVATWVDQIASLIHKSILLVAEGTIFVFYENRVAAWVHLIITLNLLYVEFGKGENFDEFASFETGESEKLLVVYINDVAIRVD